MTLQWTFVAFVLYLEIFLVSVLLLPFISPRIWQKLFKSRLVASINHHAKIPGYIFIAILVLLFAESVRESMKYSEPLEDEEIRNYPEAETALHMKMFRAQRNMYLAGFTMFLHFILRRLVVLIANEAQLMAQGEASFKQAQSASAVAQQLLDEKSLTDENKKNAATEKDDDETKEKEAKPDQSLVEKELTQTLAELEKTKEELYKAEVDLRSMQKQAKATNMEYDRLMLEHEKLQKKLDTAEGDVDKKGN